MNMDLIFIGIILNHLGLLNGWMLFWYIIAWLFKFIKITIKSL